MGKIIAAAVFGIVFLVSLSLVLGYFGFTSEANRFENGIEAQYSENQNTFDNGWKKVAEAAQITDQQADNLKALYSEVARGLKDQNQLMLALGQFNPQMDQSTYRKVQQLIESFHNDFRQRQTELIARRNEYKNLLTVSWNGRFFNMVAGYPRIDLKRYDIVTSTRTVDAFNSKRVDEMEIYRRKK